MYLRKEVTTEMRINVDYLQLKLLLLHNNRKVIQNRNIFKTTSEKAVNYLLSCDLLY